MITLTLCQFLYVITPHAQRERGNVISVGVHIIYMYMFVDEKNLNRTLAINSPFQTFAVGLLVLFGFCRMFFIETTLLGLSCNSCSSAT